MAHSGYNQKNNAVSDHYKYKYKYNGKELQEELNLNLYDYGARNYDAAIGRWFNVDPLGEKAPNWTPYRYGFNNPLKYTDPTGMFENDDWYLNDTSGELEWINGSGEVDGYNHLGEDLIFHFSSFIDRTSWNQDKGAPWAPFDVSGEKLYSSVTLDFSQDKDGNLIGLNSVKWSSEIMTNDGGFKGVEYNRDGFINDTFFNFSKNSGTQSKQWLTFSLEKHAKVPLFEALVLWLKVEML